MDPLVGPLVDPLLSGQARDAARARWKAEYHQVFLDLSKAYDTVHRPRLFEILEAYGVGENLMKVLKDLGGF
jgi:hypothetical protein